MLAQLQEPLEVPLTQPESLASNVSLTLRLHPAVEQEYVRQWRAARDKMFLKSILDTRPNF